MGGLLPVFSPQFQMNGRSNPIINEPDQALIMDRAPPTLPAPPPPGTPTCSACKYPPLPPGQLNFYRLYTVEFFIRFPLKDV